MQQYLFLLPGTAGRRSSMPASAAKLVRQVYCPSPSSVVSGVSWACLSPGRRLLLSSTNSGVTRRGCCPMMCLRPSSWAVQLGCSHWNHSRRCVAQDKLPTVGVAFSSASLLQQMSCLQNSHLQYASFHVAICHSITVKGPAPQLP